MEPTKIKSYDISGGELYFYSPPDMKYIVWQTYITMKDPVDKDILQRALDTTAELFPFFNVRLVLQGEDYVLQEIEEPFLVYEQEEYIAPGDPAVYGRLCTVGCWGNVIRHDFYHGLCDGIGHMEFQRHLLYYYCLYRYDGDIKCRDILAPGTPPDPEFYSNFDDSGLSVKEVPPLGLPEKWFILPEKRIEPGEKHTIYRISLNQKEFMRYCNTYDGSPATITALLFARAIDEVHPVREDPIVVRMPVDLRGALGRKKTMRSCIGRLNLVYDERIGKLSFSKQSTCFRGMVFAQSDPDRLVNSYLASRAEIARKKTMPLKERFELLRPVLNTMGPLVSYVGQQDYGDVERYRTNHTCLADATHNGIMIEITTSAENINLSFVNSIDTDAYYKAFVHQMDLVGIAYTLNEPISFVPLFTEIPMP